MTPSVNGSWSSCRSCGDPLCRREVQRPRNPRLENGSGRRGLRRPTRVSAAQPPMTRRRCGPGCRLPTVAPATDRPSRGRREPRATTIAPASRTPTWQPRWPNAPATASCWTCSGVASAPCRRRHGNNWTCWGECDAPAPAAVAPSPPPRTASGAAAPRWLRSSEPAVHRSGTPTHHALTGTKPGSYSVRLPRLHAALPTRRAGTPRASRPAASPKVKRSPCE